MTITFSPLVLWGFWDLALGSDFIARHAWRYSLVPMQVYVWLLIAAGLLQLVAVFILRKGDQKPRDWISVTSLIDAGLSIALTVFFWTQISALIFRG
jgi:membrane-associated PAP2 superfamily phosphatase